MASTASRWEGLSPSRMVFADVVMDTFCWSSRCSSGWFRGLYFSLNLRTQQVTPVNDYKRGCLNTGVYKQPSLC